MTDSTSPPGVEGTLHAWVRTHEPALAHAAQAWFQPAPHHFDAEVSRWCLALTDASALLDALPDRLLPTSVARMAQRRRRSFVAGRLCAERCLTQLAVRGPVAQGDRKSVV